LKSAEETITKLKAEKEGELEFARKSNADKIDEMVRNHSTALKQLNAQIESLKADHAAQLHSETTKLQNALMDKHQREKIEILEQNRLALSKIEASLLESRKRGESLEKAKRELEEVFKKDESEKIKKLAADLDSSRYELECKMEELRRLRSENANLKFVADAMQSKEQEIQKLTHRIQDLSAELTHKVEIEKALNLQLEELRKEARSKLIMVEEMKKEKDTLSYRLSELEESLHDSENSVMLRSTHSARFNGPRPNSSQLPMPSNSSRDECTMAKSLDSTNLSLYQQHGRHRALNTPSKIYTPEGTYEVEEETSKGASCNSISELTKTATLSEENG